MSLRQSGFLEIFEINTVRSNAAHNGKLASESVNLPFMSGDAPGGYLAFPNHRRSYKNTAFWVLYRKKHHAVKNDIF